MESDKNELYESVRDGIKERFSNPLLVHFLFFNIICHWQIIYVSFFVSEENIIRVTGWLKNEYIIARYLDIGSPSFWLLLILPFLMTYLFIWFFPKKLFIPAYTEDLSYKVQKKIISLEKEHELEVKRLGITNIIKDRVSAEEKIKSTEVKIAKIDPSTVWAEEYSGIGEDRLINIFLPVAKKYYSGRPYQHEVDSNSLMFADTHELIKLGEESTFELSEKGRFFAKKLQNSNK